MTSQIIRFDCQRKHFTEVSSTEGRVGVVTRILLSTTEQKIPHVYDTRTQNSVFYCQPIEL